MMMSEDVLIQIFLWLPVISLLRFKSVCKSWRSIIENPFFIHLHATTTTTTKSGGGGSRTRSSFVFFRNPFVVEEKKERVIFTISGDKFDVFEDLGRPSVEFEEDWVNRLKREEDLVSRRRKTFYDGIFMVGCCNGIICLRDEFSRNIAVWNPAIKKSKILPEPSNLLTENHYHHPTSSSSSSSSSSVFNCVGFGIDYVKTTITKNINDYKVLLITSLKPCDATSSYDVKYYGHNRTKFPFARSVQVYSSSTNLWKYIDANNLSVAHPNLDIKSSYSPPLHLNGRCFFMAQYYIKTVEEEEEEVLEDDDDNSGLQAMPLIMSFDFTQEIFRTIELPYNRRSKFYPRCDADMFLFGDKIALNDVLFYSNNECDIWVLNEQQGVMEESWTKFYTFGPYEIYYRPRCLADNGEFAIMHGYDQDPYCQGHGLKLQLLNLSTGEANDIQCNCKAVCQVDVYKPSLVPISRIHGATVR